MKYLITILTFITCSFTIKGQEGKASHIQEKERQTAYLKNTEITIDHQIFDYRILKYYSEETLRNMSPVKRNQIHFIYTASYIIKDPQACPGLTIKDIDVATLEIYRKEDASAVVEYGKDCKVQLELISRKSLKQKMEEFAK